MKEYIAKSLDGLIFIFAFVYVSGWLILICAAVLSWVFPSKREKLESYLQKAIKFFQPGQKFSLLGIVICLILEWVTDFFE